MSFPWDNNQENKYQTLLQTKKELFSKPINQFPPIQSMSKEQFDHQIKQEKSIFSNNSSNILNNSSIPVNIYPVNPMEYQQQQLPNSQMSRRDQILDEKTQRRQRELLSKSAAGNPENDLALNNYIRDQNLLKPGDTSFNRNIVTSKSMVEKPLSSYGQELKRQMIMKDAEKKSAHFKEKLLEQKLLADRLTNDWFGKQGSGAPIRDKFGNILTSRKKPTNPNIMSYEWGGSPNISNYPRPISGRQSLPMPEINVLAPDENLINKTINEDNFTRNNIGNNQISESNAAGGLNDNLSFLLENNNNFMDMEAIAKKEREKAVQQENYLLMEAKKKEKENERFLKRQEAELLDLKLQKEKEEIEARRMFEFGHLPLESRNLFETNFDMSKLLNKTSRVNFATNRTLREATQTNFHATGKRPRTPVEDVEREIKELRQKEEALKLQKRLLQELPLEVSKTVQSSIDVEMQKLKNELNFQQNLLGEQIMNLKGQLLQSNDLRQESEKEIRRLHKEIQKTQLVDEIRQRELYMALILKNRKPGIYHTITERLEEPETIDFRFPEKPKPYYNMYDPSIEDLEFRNRDIHEILNNRTEYLPISIHDERIAKGSHWDQSLEGYSYGQRMENENTPNLPDDFANLQGITQPRIVEDGDQVYYLDTYATNLKRLDSLEDKHPRLELEKLDSHLFGLLTEVNKGKNTFDDLQIDKYRFLSKEMKGDETKIGDFYD